MRRVWFVLLLAASVAWGADPYGELEGYVAGLPWFKPERLVEGEYPYVTVYRHSQDPADRRETYLPLSSLEGTRAVARDLRLAWQRYEERYYWAAMTALDAPAAPLRCAMLKAAWEPLKGRLALNPARPPATVSALPFYAPPELENKLDAPWRDPSSRKLLRLDGYSYYWAGLPAVNPDDFCDVVLEHLPDYLIPTYLISPIKICNGETGICISNPSYPDPDIILWDSIATRLNHVFKTAAGKYYADYKLDVLKALKPRGEVGSLLNGGAEIFLPAPWTGHELGAGAVMAPVIATDPKAAAGAVGEIIDVLRAVHYKDEKLEQAKWAYYGDPLTKLAKRLSLPAPSLPEAVDAALSGLHGEEYRSARVRGIWPLEELKRWFPVAPPQVQEALGYSSYFQVYSRFDVTVLPDPAALDAGQAAAALAVRSLHFWVVPMIYTFWVTGGVSVRVDLKNVHAIPVSPYVLPFVGSRTYWDWVSVPESYPVPRQKGDPAVPGGVVR